MIAQGTLQFNDVSISEFVSLIAALNMLEGVSCEVAFRGHGATSSGQVIFPDRYLEILETKPTMRKRFFVMADIDHTLVEVRPMDDRFEELRFTLSAE